VSPKWSGRCQACGEWNTLIEEPLADTLPKGLSSGKGRAIELHQLNAGDGAEEPRTASGIAELDRVCGGGLVPGSAILIGGDPGIGKSTLLLQAMAQLARRGIRCAYFSGRRRPGRCACGRAGWAWPTLPSDLPRRPACATSPPPSTRPRHHMLW
jgi:DNA repair protein RadA/Sms